MISATTRAQALPAAAASTAAGPTDSVTVDKADGKRAGRMLAFGAAGALGGASLVTAPWAFNEFVLNMSEWGKTAEVRPGPSAKAWLAVGGLAIAGAALGAYLGSRD